MSTKRRTRHTPEQIVRKLRDASAMLSAGKDQAAVLQALEIPETLTRLDGFDHNDNEEYEYLRLACHTMGDTIATVGDCRATGLCTTDGRSCRTE